MSKGLERRVERLEHTLGEGDVAHVYVVWSDEEAETVELAPGETLKVVTWTEHDEVLVETVRGEDLEREEGDV